MTHHDNLSGTWINTASGTLLSVAVTIQSGDMLKTAILASIGACVSFFVSLLLRHIMHYFRRK
jgi:hypothetical protein